MPPIPAGGVAAGSHTMTFLAAGGDEASVSLPYEPAASAPQVQAFITAIGNMSNAAGFRFTTAIKREHAKILVNPLDESYSSAATKAVMTFQNEELDILKVAVPAPDESLFAADGETLDPDNAQVAAAITAVLAYLNAGTLTWGYLYGNRADTARKHATPRIVRESIEPGDLVLPPPAPGLPE